MTDKLLDVFSILEEGDLFVVWPANFQFTLYLLLQLICKFTLFVPEANFQFTLFFPSGYECYKVDTQ